jgi:hypothetical protein
MRSKEGHRRYILRTVLAPAEVDIGDVALMAIGEAEVLAGPGHVVQLVIRQVFAQPIALVVGEPEVLGLRVPVEAQGIAHPDRDRLDVAAVEIHSDDPGVLI